MPGLWKHMTRPVQFTLTVDDFGVKCELKIDWDGKLYCSITLNWDYQNKHVNISMPGYIDKMLAHFDHNPPTRPQHSPHMPPL